MLNIKQIRSSEHRYINKCMSYAMSQTGLTAKVLFKKTYKKARLERNYAEHTMWDEDICVKLPFDGRIVHLVMPKGAENIDYCCGTEILERAKWDNDPLNSKPCRVLRAQLLRKYDSDPSKNLFCDVWSIVAGMDISSKRTAKQAWLDAKRTPCEYGIE